MEIRETRRLLIFLRFSLRGYTLDEAGDEQALTKLFTALKNWHCRVIITSRPYGYTGRLPFDVTEYRLAPLSDEQARMFVGKWFAGNEGQARMNELLARSPSVQQVSQNPFLLTLLCWVAERRELSQEITRTQLYDRVTRDLLGLPVNSAGRVDDQRANEWLPLLTELAFTFFQENAGRAPISSERLLSLIAASHKRPVPLGLTPIRTDNLAPRQQATYLLDELRQKRLLVPLTRDRATYVAPHRSFLEYLTACALADQANHEGWQTIADLMDKKAWLPEWEEVLILVTGKLNDPIPLLELLRDAKSDDFFRHRLCLAARCLLEVSNRRKWQTAGLEKASVKNKERLQRLIQLISQDVINFWLGIQKWDPDYVLMQGIRIPGSNFPHITQGLLAIAQISLASLLPVIVRRFLYSYQPVPSTVVDVLGQMGQTAAQPEVLDMLCRMLADPDRWLPVKNYRTWRDHYERMRQEDKVRHFAAEALMRIGQAATQPKVLAHLINVLKRKSLMRDRPLTAEILGRMGQAAAQPEVLAALVNVLRDQEDEARYSAAIALMRIGTKPIQTEVLAVLVNWVTMGQSSGRKAIDALGQIGQAAAQPEILNVLITRLRWTEPDIQAALALGRMGPAAAQPEVLAALVKMLYSQHSTERSSAAKALGWMGQAAAQPEVVTTLVRLLPDLATRFDVTMALRQMGSAAAHPEVLTALVKTLNEPDFPSLSYVAEASMKIGSATTQPAVIAALIKALSDPNNSVRLEALIALGELGIAAKQSEVQAALSDFLHYAPRQGKQRMIKERLLAARINYLDYKISWREPMLILDKVLARVEDERFINDWIRCVAAYTLVRMEQTDAWQEAMNVLLKAVACPNPDVHYYAASALGQMLMQGARIFKKRWGKWEVKTVAELSQPAMSQ